MSRRVGVILVRRRDNSLAAFRVFAVRTCAKRHFPTAAVYGPPGLAVTP
jgi:hypothetical protein